MENKVIDNIKLARCMSGAPTYAFALVLATLGRSGNLTQEGKERLVRELQMVLGTDPEEASMPPLELAHQTTAVLRRAAAYEQASGRTVEADARRVLEGVNAFVAWVLASGHSKVQGSALLNDLYEWSMLVNLDLLDCYPSSGYGQKLLTEVVFGGDR